MTGRGTMTAAAPAVGVHAKPPAPDWRKVLLHVVGSGLLLAVGAINLDLCLTGYRMIPAMGRLFLLQVIAAFGLGLAVPAIPSRLVIPGPRHPRRLPLAVWIGLLGFKEARTTAGIAAGVVEVAALLVLASGASSLGRLDWEQRDE